MQLIRNYSDMYTKISAINIIGEYQLLKIDDICYKYMNMVET